MIFTLESEQARRDEQMHWLRRNGVTEAPEEIVDSVYTENNGRGWEIVYETMHERGGPDRSWFKQEHRVEIRVAFADAMRDR